MNFQNYTYRSQPIQAGRLLSDETAVIVLQNFMKMTVPLDKLDPITPPADDPSRDAPGPASGSQVTADDLTAITGLGATYAERLNEMGIFTFSQLAAADRTAVATTIRANETAVKSWQKDAQELT